MGRNLVRTPFVRFRFLLTPSLTQVIYQSPTPLPRCLRRLEHAQLPDWTQTRRRSPWTATKMEQNEERKGKSRESVADDENERKTGNEPKPRRNQSKRSKRNETKRKREQMDKRDGINDEKPSIRTQVSRSCVVVSCYGVAEMRVMQCRLGLVGCEWRDEGWINEHGRRNNGMAERMGKGKGNAKRRDETTRE